MGMTEIHSIAVAADFSPGSEIAVAHALQLAVEHAASLQLMHAFDVRAGHGLGA